MHSDDGDRKQLTSEDELIRDATPLPSGESSLTSSPPIQRQQVSLYLYLSCMCRLEV